MKPSFVRNFIYFPLQRIPFGDANQIFLSHKRLSGQSPDALAKYQRNALGELLRDVLINIPYYRQFHDAGDPRFDDPLAILRRLPLVSKTIIRDNLALFTNNRWRKWWRSTSGTSGTPFHFFKDSLGLIHMEAAMSCAYSWRGIEIGDKQGRIWGRPVGNRQRAMQKVKDFLFNRKRLSAFEMTVERSIKYYEILKHFRPSFLYCYPNAAFLFAQHILESNLPPLPGLKSVICTGEPLLDKQRRTLTKAFDCPIINEYGTTENGILAFECEQGATHILSDNVLLEFLRDEKPVAEGELGEIVVTELHSRSIPFVRYRTGDLGRPLFSQQCRCGRAFPLMHIVEGRQDNFILRPDGQKVYDAILAYVLKEGVAQFRATQTKSNLLIIDIVADLNYTETLEQAYRKKLQKYLGKDFHIDFRLVPTIPVEKSGKLRYFVSQVT